MFTVIKCCLYSGDGIMPFTYGLFTLSVEIPDGYKLLSVIAMSGDKSGTFTYTVIDISDAAFTVALINENDTINYPGTITFKCLVGKC
jgi:hypothetical protein